MGRTYKKGKTGYKIRQCYGNKKQRRMEESKGNEYTLIFSDVSLEDLAFHDKAGNQVTIKRIDRILKELETTPFTGIGKPHPLSFDYSGLWSRHLNKKDVIIYDVNKTKKIVQIYSARYHYLDK